VLITKHPGLVLLVLQEKGFAPHEHCVFHSSRCLCVVVSTCICKLWWGVPGVFSTMHMRLPVTHNRPCYLC
jgi:hypothetical protein